MTGIKGRTFEQWVFRRKIDLSEWLRNYSIKTIDELNSWCESNGLLKPTSESVFVHFEERISIPIKVDTKNSATKPKKALKKNSRKRPSFKSAEQSHTKAWHTPAAERPLRKKK